MTADELADRRQRAREAFYDGMCMDDVVASRAVEAAIETATRVQITPEIERSAYAELAKAEPGRHHAARRAALRAAFRAAGFEVEE